MTFINEKYKDFEWIHFSFLLLTVFCLPILQKAVPILIALWVITSIFYIYKKKLKVKGAFALFAMMALYILYALSWLWSDDKAAANFDLQQKLSLIIFPIVFLFVRYNKKQIIVLFKAFIFGCVVAIIYSVILSLIKFFHTWDTYYFFYERASYGLHVAYFSMYLCFSILTLGIGMIRQESRIFSWTLSLILIICFSIYIFILSSKAGIISMVVIDVCLLVYGFVKKKKIVNFIIYLILFIGGLYFSTQVLKFSSNRFLEMNKVIEKAENRVATKNREKVVNVKPNKSTPKVKNPGSTQLRLDIWKLSLKLIGEKPIIGHGSGDVHPALQKAYQVNGNTKAFKEDLNAHDQYLETAIATGILGLMILLSFLFKFTYDAFKMKNVLSLGFIFIICFNMLTEAMLERQAGIVFICLFICLLSSHKEQFLKIEKLN